jgi:predicted MPP superfamily phosphohydrolase
MAASFDSFAKLSKEVPIIYILGNHEFIANQEGEVVQKMEQAGVTVLEDEVMFAEEGFYFIGRTDKYQSMRSENKRATYSELLEGLDLSYPLISLDHQPVELDLAKDKGIDVVLSGHTHAGQFFPSTFFAQFFNERLYGLEKDDSLYTVVSSGIGVWGMAMRNASNSEIVIIDLK